MDVVAVEWGVVIAGKWNRAILTPNGVATRIFDLEDGSGVLLAVPFDGVSPYQIRHPDQNIIVVTDESRLQILAAVPDYETLGGAMEAGVRALKKLPETPVTAGGFNLKFRSSEVASDVAALMTDLFDTRLSDLGYSIVGRSSARSVRFDDGVLNLTLSSDEEGFRLACNFHRESKVTTELEAWLSTPIDNVRDKISNVLSAFGLTLAEAPSDDDGK
ncbi:hypothetical protein LCGC14_3012760 [marine sediment metagenome]|uniref:Uncharacterized protein n=1 Tax=marine sediment metagenome TaxID=412755 RepID=A0A0F8WY55_9ZZZZ